jgi:hypothetical protein
VNKLILPLILSQLVHASSCELVNNQGIAPYEMGGKKLSVFWSQEYSGSDLVKEELKKIEWAKNVKVALYDSGFEREFINVADEVRVDQKFSTRRNRKMTGHHGTSVANIINGPGSYGVSEKADYLVLKNVRFTVAYKTEFGKYEESGVFPKVISNSYGWSNSEDVKEVSLRAAEKDILWFLAAGNDYPTNVAPVEDTSGSILIGSFAPSGLQSSFSQISENVAILAPADDMQASIDGKGKHTNFGGTSGATPLVAGNAINVASLIPELNKEDYIKLIKNTALISFEKANDLEFKTGLFNGYKAFKVAEKIAKLCGYQQSKNDIECVRRELDNKLNYIFAAKDVTLSNQEILSDEADCGLRKSQLRALRENALLTNHSKHWEALSEIYKSLGYDKNAEFFTNMAEKFEMSEALRERMEKNALLSISNERYFDSYTRYQEMFSYKYQMGLASLLTHDKNVSSYWTSSYLVRFGQKLDQRVVDYLKASLKYAPEEVKEYIEDVIYQ